MHEYELLEQVLCPAYCHQCCYIQEDQLLEQEATMNENTVCRAIITDHDLLFIQQKYQSCQKIISGDILKVIDFYNLFLYIINVVAKFIKALLCF